MQWEEGDGFILQTWGLVQIAKLLLLQSTNKCLLVNWELTNKENLKGKKEKETFSWIPWLTKAEAVTKAGFITLKKHITANEKICDKSFVHIYVFVLHSS